MVLATRERTDAEAYFADDPLYGEPQDDRYGPKRDPDYRDAPRPNKTWTMEDAETEKGVHQLRLAQAREYAEWLSQDRFGYFEDDAQKIRDNIVEPFRIGTIAADHAYITGTIASMELYLALASRDLTETAEALVVEDAALYFRECEIRQHATRTGSLLKWTEPDWFQRYGMLVGLDTLNPMDETCGLAMSLIDPLTVFPVWGGAGGLDVVYRVYEDTGPNIVGNYGGPWGKEHDRIERIVKKKAGVSGRGRRLGSENLHTVTECWNRDWCQVIIDDDVEICTRRHGYGENPFTIVVGGFGISPGSNVGSSKSHDPYVLNSIWGQISVSDRAVDLARQMLPYQWRKLYGHATREAAAGRMLTAFRDFAHPTWIYEVDTMTKHLVDTDIKAEADHVIEVNIGNKLSTLNKVPPGDLITPLEAYLQMNAEQGPWSQINAGGIPPQTSDSAIGTMLELGGAGQVVLVQGLELFHQMRAEARMRRWRDWGKALGAPGARGSLSVPNQAPTYGGSPVHKLEPEVLERTGCYLHSSLFHWRPNPAMANYIAGLRAPGGASGAPLISDETARRRLRVVQDPDREAFRIEDEMINALPAIATQRALRRIDREAAAEIEAGDYENADALITAGIELEYERQKQVMMGEAAPPQPPPGMAGPPPEGGGEPPLNGPQPPGQQGLSPVQMGQGVGMEGSRPVEPSEPQGMNPNPSATVPR